MIYKDIFMHMPDGAIIIDRSGKVQELNQAAEGILGISTQKALGRELGELLGIKTIHSDKMMDTGLVFRDVEIIIPGKERNIHTLISGVPVRRDGIIRGGVIFLRPIENVHLLVNRFSGARASYTFSDIVTCSNSMQEVIQLAAAAAGSSSSVLLEGESGTGKEVFAQAIHNESLKKNGPFVAVNCGAIPRELIGSELFGYVEGAFTGARKGGSPGKFELASGGTLFLDEIGDMPLEQQVTLLRVLQEKCINRMGDSRLIPVDVRVICATNKNLWQEVENANFRADLYYRLNVINIFIPPLRRRSEDIMILFAYFLNKIHGAQAPSVDEKNIIEEKLKSYDWPGNIRELQNVVERMVHLAGMEPLAARHLPPEIKRINNESMPADLCKTDKDMTIYDLRIEQKKFQQEQEREQIITLLGRFNGNVSRVARVMGVNRSTIYRKMRFYKIGE